MTAEAYPLSWPHGWPRTAANKRQRAIFATSGTETRQRHGLHGPETYQVKVKRDLSVYAAMRRLQDQLDKLGASNVLLSTNVELRLDGQPRSNRTPPTDPGAPVYFKLKGQDRVLACDKWDRVPDNIAAIAGHIDAIRRQDRYGVGTLDQAFAGYAALPAPGYVHVRPWRRVLGLPDDGEPGNSIQHVTIEHAESSYRALARQRHPDNGGSHSQMAELNAAIAEARKELGA